MTQANGIKTTAPASAPPPKPTISPRWKSVPNSAPKLCIDGASAYVVPSDLEAVSDAARDAIHKAMQLNQWPWYFFGLAGRGKTSAAACCVRLYHGLSGVFDCSSLTREFANARGLGGGGKIRNTFRDYDLIVLDDIGTREMSGAQMDALLALLNVRHGKPLIVTGNLSPSQLASVLDDRIASRVCSGVCIEFSGPDRRLAKAKLLKG